MQHCTTGNKELDIRHHDVSYGEAIADIISFSIAFKVSHSISVFLNEIFSQKGCQFNDIG